MFKENRVIYFNSPEETSSEDERRSLSEREILENRDAETNLRGLENEGERLRQEAVAIDTRIQNVDNEFNQSQHESSNNSLQLRALERLFGQSAVRDGTIYSQLLLENNIFLDAEQNQVLTRYLNAQKDLLEYKVTTSTLLRQHLEAQKNDLQLRASNNSLEIGRNEAQIARVRTEILQAERDEIVARGANAPLSEAELRRVNEIEATISDLANVIENSEIQPNFLTRTPTTFEINGEEISRDQIGSELRGFIDSGMAEKNLAVQTLRLELTDLKVPMDQVDSILLEDHLDYYLDEEERGSF